MGRTATRPLNSEAVTKADDEFYALHPEFIDENGQRIPLDPCDPSQAALRTEWMDLYEKHGGEVTDSNDPSRQPGSPEQPCPGTGPTPAPPPAALEIIDDAGAVVSGTTVTKIVGQKIKLSVRTNPAGQNMTNIQWTIPVERVKAYAQSGPAGTVTNLPAADLQAAGPVLIHTVEFHWTSGGNKQVQVSATVGGANRTASVNFNVLRPTVDHFTITVSSVNVTSSHFGSPGSPVLTAYQPTPAPAKYGSQWDAKVTAPAGGAGKIGFTQRIIVNRTRKPNAGADQHFSSGGSFILDGDLGIQYSGPQSIAASASATLDGAAYADSPKTPLDASLREKSVNESFELYLMYKHTDTDSIWVTLSMGTWGWAGTTTRVGAPGGTGNTWNPATGTSMPSTNGANSTTLPTWARQFSSIRWV